MNDRDGDSGSAVFQYYAAGDSAVMVGQAFASDTVAGLAYFSSINNIQAEFSTVIMTIYGWF